MASTHTQHGAHAGGSQAGGGSAQNPWQAGSGKTGGSAATMENVKDAARQTGEQLKDSAQSAAEGLRRQGEGFVSEKKSEAAEQLSTLGAAVRSAAEKLRGDDQAPVARYAEMAADRIDDVARFIGDSDVGSLVRNVERAARRRPELFLGGMFLVGLGISRFLKASRDDDRDWRTQGSP